MNEELKKQAEMAQAERQHQSQLAEENKAREDKTKQEDERKREEERQKEAQRSKRPFDQVEVQYRYVMENLKKYNDRIDAARRSDPAKPEQAAGKESPAMQRYKAHEKAMSGKVQEHIKAQGQSRTQAQEQDQGRNR